MNEGQANGGIGDMNARNNTRMEGYRTRITYVKGLCGVV